VHNGV